MNKFLPAGRLAKVEHDGVVIQIQTEFSWRPHPRIATGVFIDGVVIHKIQKDWDAPVDTDEQQRVVENFINRQHAEIVAIIESQKKDLVNRQKRISTEELLEKILHLDGVNAAWCMTKKGVISPDSGGRELLPEYRTTFETLIDLCGILSANSSVGQLIDGNIVLQDDSLVILRRQGRHYIIGYDPGIEPTELVTRIAQTVGDS